MAEATATTTPAPTPTANRRPTLRIGAHDIAAFGRADQDEFVLDVTVNPASHDAFPRLVYAHLKSFSHEVIELTIDEYVRIWRTLVLKRAMDAWEHTHQGR
ncbi:uncharacterized protein DMENIID0001_016410 [Sergentomyia squamirostris]